MKVEEIQWEAFKVEIRTLSHPDWVEAEGPFETKEQAEEARQDLMIRFAHSMGDEFEQFIKDEEVETRISGPVIH